MRFDDSAPRRREDRGQLAAMLRSAAAEVDTTGPGSLDLVEYVEIAGRGRPGAEMIWGEAPPLI